MFLVILVDAEFNFSVLSLFKQHIMEEGQDFVLSGKAAITEANLSKSSQVQYEETVKSLAAISLTGVVNAEKFSCSLFDCSYP